MMQLPVYNNRTPLSLSEEEKQKVIKTIKEAIDSLSFFCQRLADGADMNDVHTHMSLLEHTVSDLSPLVGYDSVLAEELERRHAKIRELNLRVRELEEQRGKEVSATAASAALRRYENDFSAWYEALGFRYASTTFTAYGLRAEITAELNHCRSDRLTTSKELHNALSAILPFITESPDWDIVHDHYHSELLDTDKNREMMKRVIKESFPSARITSFISRANDFDSFSLRCDVFLPYPDIEQMEKNATIQLQKEK